MADLKIVDLPQQEIEELTEEEMKCVVGGISANTNANVNANFTSDDLYEIPTLDVVIDLD